MKAPMQKIWSFWGFFLWNSCTENTPINWWDHKIGVPGSHKRIRIIQMRRITSLLVLFDDGYLLELEKGVCGDEFYWKPCYNLPSLPHHWRSWRLPRRWRNTNVLLDCFILILSMRGCDYIWCQWPRTQQQAVVLSCLFIMILQEL